MEGDTLCVYDTRQSGIIETGFDCPPARPLRTDFGDLIVCSDGKPPMDFEQDLQDRYPDADLNADSDTCADVICPSGEICVDGTCEPDSNNLTMCVPTAEVCDDDVDNDCDGSVDCDDPDCATDPACAVTCPDTNEPNDTLANASSAGSDVDSALCGADDVDVWTTDAVGGDRISITVTLPDAADVTVEVLDGAGEQLYDEHEALVLSSADIADGVFSGGGVITRGAQLPVHVRVSGEETAYQLQVQSVTPNHLTDVAEIGAGDNYTCAMTEAGHVLGHEQRPAARRSRRALFTVPCGDRADANCDTTLGRPGARLRADGRWTGLLLG